LEGVGAALLLFPYYLPFFHPQNHYIYHHGLPVTSLIGGLFVDLLGCSILVTGCLIGAQHLRPPLRKLAEALFAGLMLWSMVGFVLQVLIFEQSRFEYWGRIWWQSAIAIPLLPCVFVFFLPRYAEPAVRAIRVVIAGFAFSALWIVPQLIYLALLRQPVQNVVSAHRPDPAQTNSDRRIVWILLDELSYNQTFDHRAAGIELPNLDGLRAVSVSFSDLNPIGYGTNRIIPGLFSGRRIDKFRSTIDGKLSYFDETQRRWLAYDPNATLFGLAQRNGWSTGIDGWYNPYCSILAPVLDSCYRDPGIVIVPMEEYGASEDRTVLANAAALPNVFWAALTHRKKINAEEHIQAYLNIMARTKASINDNKLRFLFLHIPVPHPPGIYDRQAHVLCPGGNYLDNLVLADDTLGVLMREIAATPSASQTTVIVTSDHSWRIPLWRPAPGWTREEERVSGAKFDERPVLLVHFPDQKSGQDVRVALSQMLEHDMIAGMLLGQIENPEDLNTFLTRQGR
jgi:hypothetical protein